MKKKSHRLWEEPFVDLWSNSEILSASAASCRRSLRSQTDERLRRYLSEAIGLCSMCRCNRASFGDSGAVAPLVRYLKSKDEAVHQRTAMALYQLSRNPNNIITMHAKGAVKVSRNVKGKF